MHFLDECHFVVEAGNGGDGAVAFRREKFVPFGGPAGGDGGKGGSVILEANSGLGTLYDFRRQSIYRAKRGENGGGRDCYGAAASDLILQVPLGSVVTDRATGEHLGDLLEKGSTLRVAKGGHGGRGNKHFATGADRAPRKAEPGGVGETREIQIELKVMADVGMLGFPNAGKSTFVSAVSRAKPKIADYPFTTLQPHLGVVEMDDDSMFVVADIPGLIGGASEGVGLGLRFLRHVERTRVLVHLVTLTADPERSPSQDYRTLREELVQFNPMLAERPEIVVLSQADRPEVLEAWPALKEEFKEEFGVELLAVSSATHWQLTPLLRKIQSHLTTPEPTEPASP